MKGPSTYLHAGSGKGWPHDQSTEDTFEVPSSPVQPWPCPPHPLDGLTAKQAQAAFLNSPVFTPEAIEAQVISTVEKEYRAEFDTKGRALLILHRRQTVASFDTYADAQLAAEALNNHEGY
jgi:hypothetical protein